MKATNDKLDKIEEELMLLRKDALKQQYPNIALINDLVNRLNLIEDENKWRFKDFVESLNEELFQKNIGNVALDLKKFEPKNDDLKGFSNSSKKDITQLKSKIHFKDLLKSLIADLESHFLSFKGYFILKLENDQSKDYNFLVLHDDNYFISPVKQTLSKKFNAIEPDICSINEFFPINPSEHEDKNLLCLILLMPNTYNDGNRNDLVSKFNSLIKCFENFENISLVKNEKQIQRDWKSDTRREEFLNELKFICCTHLSNGSISHEEEKIIKKLSQNSFSDSSVVIYNPIKQGYSGSNVIEVIPKRKIPYQYENKFIIKYGELDKRKKLREEYENFTSNVGNYAGFNNYQCHYEYTETHEGLLYSYAKNDYSDDTYSFSKILNDKDNIQHNRKEIIVDDLFKSPLFGLWNNSNSKVKCKVSDLYSKYINETEIVSQIKLILNKSDDELRKTELQINFNKIWNYESDFCLKICHGDLHSDNFFIDSENQVFLIDFGFTTDNHCFIDHSALECSIKFNHFPRYINLRLYEDIERELLSQRTFFERSTSFNSTSRNDLLELLEVVKRVRNDISLKEEFNIDVYFISLFIMTFRQIRYSNMNQLYALKSADILGRHIVKKLNL